MGLGRGELASANLLSSAAPPHVSLHRRSPSPSRDPCSPPPHWSVSFSWFTAARVTVPLPRYLKQKEDDSHPFSASSACNDGRWEPPARAGPGLWVARPKDKTAIGWLCLLTTNLEALPFVPWKSPMARHLPEREAWATLLIRGRRHLIMFSGATSY